MSEQHRLDAFIDESIRLSAHHNYHPTAFIGMRGRWGTVGAVKRLVVSGDIQTGFQRLCDLGLREWTIESAVAKFPSLFTKDERDAAQWRLDQAVMAQRP